MISERLFLGVGYLAFSTTAYCFAVAVEAVLAWRKKVGGLYGARATIASVGIILGHFTIGLAWNTLVVIPLFHYVHRFAPFRIGPTFQQPLAEFLSWSFLALILVDDLIYYVHHRLCHQLKWLWAVHHTHHSTNEYNMLVAARISWFDFNTIPFWLPLTFIGFDPDVVITVHFLNLMINIFIHTKLIGRLPILDFFVMTPSNHRIHHATNAAYKNKNYGGAFVIWDKLFGTYAREEEEVVFETSPELADERILQIATHGMRSVFASDSADRNDRRSEGA